MLKSKWFKILIGLSLAFILFVFGYILYVYMHAKNTVNKEMHEPVDSIDSQIAKKKLKSSEKINVLLLGIDSDGVKGDGEIKGRSDALMILTLDPKSDQMQLISIPRDTRTHIVGKGFDDKINHAYAFGGADMAVATVEEFLDIEMDYYVSINMEGFKQLVDELGTITVNNDIAWEDGKYNFDFGPIEMDGDKTMSFVRMRKQDPAGDFGRTKRQRQVIEGIINEGASISSVTKITNYIDILGKNMATNMDMDDMKKLLFDYKDTRKKFTDYQMQGASQRIEGIYYLIVDGSEVEKVREMIKNFGS